MDTLTQLTHKILMIRPANFTQNVQTMADNHFQNKQFSCVDIHKKALAEFDDLNQKLLAAGIQVCTVPDQLDPETPDAIFPNNRISFHGDGVTCIYPMKTPNRRLEHQLDVLKPLEKLDMFHCKKQLDYRFYEKEEMFLEGTGSLVLDRVNRIAYAAKSARTSSSLVTKWCLEMGYRPISFAAKYQNVEIYHTNVLMSLGEKVAVICSAAIPNLMERQQVLSALNHSHHEVIDISLEQLSNFCGNILQIKNQQDETFFAMSQCAFEHFSSEQINLLKQDGALIYSDISTIEKAAGGSVRCMLAEVF